MFPRFFWDFDFMVKGCDFYNKRNIKKNSQLYLLFIKIFLYYKLYLKFKISTAKSFGQRFDNFASRGIPEEKLDWMTAIE
jgi:hypothetical protein